MEAEARIKYEMVKKEVRCLALILLLASLSLSENCGKEGWKAIRISGGKLSHENQFPWMVYFYANVTYMFGLTQRFGCGGSIISTRHIITALHCTEVLGKPVEFGKLRAGIHDVSGKEYSQEIKIEKALYPPINKNYHDLAILLLDESLDLLDPTIGRVCLPKSEKEEYIGERVKSMGWGMEQFGKRKPLLKDVDLQVADRKEKYYLFTKVDVINGVYQDPCAGDSGGPLLINKQGRWTIIGTVQGQGYDCRSDTLAPIHDGLGRWSKITPHLKWIKSVIKEIDDTDNDRTVGDGDHDVKGKMGKGWGLKKTTVQPTTWMKKASEYTECCRLCKADAPDTSLYTFKGQYKKCYCRKPLPGVRPETKVTRSEDVTGLCVVSGMDNGNVNTNMDNGDVNTGMDNGNVNTSRSNGNFNTVMDNGNFNTGISSDYHDCTSDYHNCDNANTGMDSGNINIGMGNDNVNTGINNGHVNMNMGNGNTVMDDGNVNTGISNENVNIGNLQSKK